MNSTPFEIASLIKHLENSAFNPYNVLFPLKEIAFYKRQLHCLFHPFRVFKKRVVSKRRDIKLDRRKAVEQEHLL